MSLLSLATLVQCANEATGHTMADMLSGGSLQSDCDDQLLITVYFPQDKAVHVDQLRFTTPCGAAGPKSVSVFVNTGPVQFETIERLKPDDAVTLSWVPSTDKPNEMVATAPVPHVARRAATQLTVFVTSNISGGEDDVTVVSGFDVMGRNATSQGVTQAPPKKC